MLIDYLRRFFKLWMFWFWFIVFDFIGYIIKLFVSFNIPSWGYWVIAVFGVLLANFKLFTQITSEYNKLKMEKHADITLERREHFLSINSWGNNIPRQLKFKINFDIRNKGDENGRIKSVQVTKLDVQTSLLSWQSNKVRWVRYRKDGERSYDQYVAISWPYSVEAKKIDQNLICEIEVDVMEENSEKFAERLDELNGYTIVIGYQCEGIEGSVSEKTLEFKGLFEDIKTNIIEKWKKEAVTVQNPNTVNVVAKLVFIAKKMWP